MLRPVGGSTKRRGTQFRNTVRPRGTICVHPTWQKCGNAVGRALRLPQERASGPMRERVDRAFVAPARNVTPGANLDKLGPVWREPRRVYARRRTTAPTCPEP